MKVFHFLCVKVDVSVVRWLSEMRRHRVLLRANRDIFMNFDNKTNAFHQSGTGATDGLAQLLSAAHV
jgi:hypothetical protein